MLCADPVFVFEKYCMMKLNSNISVKLPGLSYFAFILFTIQIRLSPTGQQPTIISLSQAALHTISLFFSPYNLLHTKQMIALFWGTEWLGPYCFKQHDSLFPCQCISFHGSQEVIFEDCDTNEIFISLLFYINVRILDLLSVWSHGKQSKYFSEKEMKKTFWRHCLGT